MLKKLLLGSWVLAAMLVSGGASADSYWGLGVGNASFSLKNLGVVGVEDGTAVKIFGGTRNGDFGFEGSLSGSEHDWDGSGGLASHHVTNLVLSGVAYHALSDGFDVYGKLGLNLWGTHYEILGVDSDTENGIGLALGAGLDIAATEHFHIRLEFEMMPGIDDGTDEGDITQMTINGAFFF
jgi:opacity protein-like surface antigen